MVDRQWTRALFDIYSWKEEEEKKGKKEERKTPKNKKLRASKQKLSPWNAMILHPVSMVLRNCEVEKENHDWRGDQIALRKDPGL